MNGHQECSWASFLGIFALITNVLCSLCSEVSHPTVQPVEGAVRLLAPRLPGCSDDTPVCQDAQSGLRPRRPTHRIKTKIHPLRITKGYIELFNGNDLGQARAGLGSRGLRTQRLGGPQLSLHSPALKDADCTPFQGTQQTCSFPLGEPAIPLNSETRFHLLCSVVPSRGPCLA